MIYSGGSKNLEFNSRVNIVYLIESWFADKSVKLLSCCRNLWTLVAATTDQGNPSPHNSKFSPLSRLCLMWSMHSSTRLLVCIQPTTSQTHMRHRQQEFSSKCMSKKEDWVFHTSYKLKFHFDGQGISCQLVYLLKHRPCWHYTC